MCIEKGKMFLDSVFYAGTLNATFLELFPKRPR